MQYSAGTQYKAHINFDPKGVPIIHLDGLQFDQVKHLAAVHDVDSHMTMSENVSFMNKWFADAEALARERASDPYHNGESLLEAFTRAMVGNKASYDPEKPMPRRLQRPAIILCCFRDADDREADDNATTLCSSYDE